MPFVKRIQTLFSSQCEDTAVKIIGVPLEETVTFRRGTSYAPQRLRELFNYIEYTTLFGNVDPTEACDLGDLELLPGNLHGSIRMIMSAYDKIEPPVIAIGGEHTLTYATTLVARPRTYIHIDGHMDLRDEYPPGSSLTHATFLRRVLEHHDMYVIMIGVRAYGEEEEKYAREHDMYVVKWRDVNPWSVVEAISTASKPAYLSIDIDVLRPSEAPGVGNPEWGGLTYEELVSTATSIVLGLDIKHADIVEYTPIHDTNDITGINVLGIVAHLVKLMGRRV